MNNIKDAIYSAAPDEDHEVIVFPDLFATGIGDFDSGENRKWILIAKILQMLLNVDGECEKKNISCVYNIASCHVSVTM